MIDIDIVLPVFKEYEEFASLVSSFSNQNNINIKQVIVPITLSNTDVDNKFRKLCKEKGFIAFEVNKEEFSHSSIRERAIFDYCKSNIVILMTQDVKLIHNNAMYNLVKDIDDKNIVYTFGRQTCPKKRCIERYIREFNYPPKSYVASKDKIKKFQIKAFFASDVFAGLSRKAFIKIGGYKGMKLPTNEDMVYMYYVLMHGYHAKFCSDAIVEHYHSYSIKGLYSRYYDTGRFFKMVHLFDKYKKNDSGLHLAFYVLKSAFKHFDIFSIIRWVPNMFVRYIAMKIGSR